MSITLDNEGDSMSESAKAGVAVMDHKPRRIADISDMPAISDTDDWHELLGWSPTYVARLCKAGKIPAVKVGRSWRVNTKEALRSMGLLHDETAE